jgi:uncharacterized protein
MNDDSSETLDAQSLFNKNLVSALRNDEFHLIILPTEKCNFRCSYCYEDFSIGRMSQATIQAVKQFINRRISDLRLLQISWFGGEPLIALPVIEEISSHIVRLAEHTVGLSYVGDMTTNGYLLDHAMAQRLLKLGIRFYQISLDGPEPIHNRTRVRLNGKGSFSQIWENLLELHDSALPINIVMRVHLTPENLPYMPEFLATVRDTFLDDSRFTVLLKPIERMGGPHDSDFEVIPQRGRSKILAELESVVMKDGESSRLFQAPNVCYAARANSLMIRANGFIGKCTVALSDPRNSIGRLRSDGTLEIENERLRPWLHGWESRNPAAIQCPYEELLHQNISPAPQA